MSYFKCDYCNDNEVYIEVDDIPESVTCYKCHISHLKQELQKTREQLEKCEDALKHYANRMGMGGTARQYFKDKDKQGE